MPVGLISADDQTAFSQAAAMVALTRNSKTASEHAKIFASILRAVVRGDSVRHAVNHVATAMRYDVKGSVETDARRQRPDPVTA